MGINNLPQTQETRLIQCCEFALEVEFVAIHGVALLVLSLNLEVVTIVSNCLNALATLGGLEITSPKLIAMINTLLEKFNIVLQ